LISDSSVVRNFSILDWAPHLASVSDGRIVIVHGVLGADATEVSELDTIAKALEAEGMEAPGSRPSTLAVTAHYGLESTLSQRDELFEILVPNEEEVELALRLQNRDERDWRASLGMRARRLDSGEAVSLAVAVKRQMAFGSDDDDGRTAYLALGGSEHFWTLDLIKRCVSDGLLNEAQAQEGYERLLSDYRFWGTPWDS
jgi:predicted nucleic acid-binding protein